MRLAWIGVALAVAAPLALLLEGCGSNDDCTCIGVGPYPEPEAGAADVGPPSAEPMLVRVEDGKTLSSDPGDGVGVFVQYTTGGQWTLWWTCDTNKTAQPCNFDINATTKDGDITNIAGYLGTTLSPPEAGAVGTDEDAGPPTFPISGQTTNQIQGVTFETKPGAILEVTAQLNGSYDGSLFYFVDGNKVKDGYKGTLTDPLDFEPTAP
jgi:hypothetical protein